MAKIISLGKLRNFRKFRCLTQKAVAARLGYSSQSGYAKIENGSVQPTAEQLAELAVIFKCSIDDLYEDEKPEKPKIVWRKLEWTLVGDYKDVRDGGWAVFARVDRGLRGLISFLEFAWTKYSDQPLDVEIRQFHITNIMFEQVDELRDEQ